MTDAGRAPGDGGGDEAARIVNHNRSTTSVLDSHPQLRRYVECFLDTFLLNGRVDPRLRELTILRVAWRCGQPYEWAQHYRRARHLGVSDDEVLAVRTAAPADLDGPIGVLAQAVDDVVDLGWMSPATFDACGRVFDDPAVLHEFLHLVAGYRMMATILNTTRPSLADARLPSWPPDGVAPPTPPDGVAPPTPAAPGAA